MREKIKNLFKEFTSLSKCEIIYQLSGALLVFGILVLLVTLVIFLTTTLKVLHNIESHCSVISNNILEAEVQIIKIQHQIQKITKDLVLANLKQSSFSSWERAVIILEVAIFLGVSVFGSISLMNFDLFCVLWEILGL